MKQNNQQSFNTKNIHIENYPLPVVYYTIIKLLNESVLNENNKDTKFLIEILKNIRSNKDLSNEINIYDIFVKHINEEKKELLNEIMFTRNKLINTERVNKNIISILSQLNNHFVDLNITNIITEHKKYNLYKNINILLNYYSTSDKIFIEPNIIIEQIKPYIFKELKKIHEIKTQNQEHDEYIVEQYKNLTKLDKKLVYNLLYKNLKENMNNLNQKQISILSNYYTLSPEEFVYKLESIIENIKTEISNYIANLSNTDAIKIKFNTILELLDDNLINNNLDNLIKCILQYYELPINTTTDLNSENV